MTRKEAREWVVRYIFSIEFLQESDFPDINAFFENFDLEGNEKNFISRSIEGIKNHIEEIDTCIAENLTSWSPDRIPRMDLAILRTSIHELKYMEEIPQGVTINEAVEIAKKYGTEDSFRFVNGVLGSLTRKDTL